jgi:hypothetical protein
MRRALVLVGFSTLAVIELETAPWTTKPVNEPPAQATIGPRDTLTTADRLEIPHILEAQPISSSEVMPLPDQTTIIAPESSNFVEDKRSSRGRKSVVMLPRPRAEHRNATAKPNRIKPMAEVKPCPSGIFDGLFRALKLSTRCQT